MRNDRTPFRRDDRTPLRNQLADLEVASAAAGEQSAVAHERLRGDRTSAVSARQAGMAGDGPSKVGRDVFAGLNDYAAAIRFNRPDAAPPEGRADAERRLTAEIVSAVQERGLVFSPNGDGWSATLVDPSLLAAADAADAEAREARKAVVDFARGNAAALDEELEAVNQADFAQAISEANTEAVAGIISLTQDAQRRRADADAALTSSDLPTATRSGAAEEAERAAAAERFRAEAAAAAPTTADLPD
jgi:hypothetical protein